MTDKPFNASITCSRNSDDSFHIRIKDNDAVKPTVDIVLTPENFAYLISSMVVEGEVIVRRPELFGKQRICEERKVTCPMSSCSGRETLRQWLIDNCQEQGWEIDAYLGSQRSIEPSSEPDSCVLNYRAMRWEEKK
jgi:hypothetical protein